MCIYRYLECEKMKEKCITIFPEEFAGRSIINIIYVPIYCTRCGLIAIGILFAANFAKMSGKHCATSVSLETKKKQFEKR